MFRVAHSASTQLAATAGFGPNVRQLAPRRTSRRGKRQTGSSKYCSAKVGVKTKVNADKDKKKTTRRRSAERHRARRLAMINPMRNVARMSSGYGTTAITISP